MLMGLVVGSACNIYDESLLLPLSGTGSAAGSTSIGGGPQGGGGPGAGGQTGGSGGVPGPDSGGSGGIGSAYSYDMIDDVDFVCDNRIPSRAGRQGYWFVFNDESGGTQSPAPGVPFSAVERPDAAPDCAMRVQGQGFTDWGFALGVHLNNDGVNPSESYDASAYEGVSFWARVGEGSPGVVRLAITDGNSVAEGGVCDAETCNDHYGSVMLFTEEWAHYHVSFSELVRDGGWGPPGKDFEPERVYGIHFVAVTPPDTTVEIWIDDIAFFAPLDEP